MLKPLGILLAKYPQYTWERTVICDNFRLQVLWQPNRELAFVPSFTPKMANEDFSKTTLQPFQQVLALQPSFLGTLTCGIQDWSLISLRNNLHLTGGCGMSFMQILTLIVSLVMPFPSLSPPFLSKCLFLNHNDYLDPLCAADIPHAEKLHDDTRKTCKFTWKSVVDFLDHVENIVPEHYFALKKRSQREG